MSKSIALLHLQIPCLRNKIFKHSADKYKTSIVSLTHNMIPIMSLLCYKLTVKGGWGGDSDCLVDKQINWWWKIEMLYYRYKSAQKMVSHFSASNWVDLTTDCLPSVTSRTLHSCRPSTPCVVSLSTGWVGLSTVKKSEKIDPEHVVARESSSLSRATE